MRAPPDRSKVFARRAFLVAAGQTVGFAALVARLWQLQVRDGAAYRLLAEENRINQRLVVPPRGRIFDRQGRPLAINEPTYRVRIVPERAPDLETTLKRLGVLVPLPAYRVREVLRQAERRRPFVPVLVRDDLSWEEVSRIAVHAPELPGVLIDSGLLRSYPHGPVLAHLLGYVGPVSEQELKEDPDPLLQLPEFRIGKTGIERAYDRELRGRAGVVKLEVNAVGREIRILRRDEGIPGRDLTLSLDLELQRYCYERLRGERAAAAVVLDVMSGAVLAQASVPSFDPSGFVNGLDPATWQKLSRDRYNPLVDKAIRGQYPPGSTFKMVTALAALESGAIAPDHEFFCPGYLQLGNRRFYCWKEGGHGWVDLVQGLAQSCDVYFYDVARRAGVEAIAAMARRFGLGRPTGIDLVGERPGFIPTRAWKERRFGEPWQKGETLITGIGQGFVLATPLQLAVMTARLCNGGRAVRPWLARPAGEAAPAPSIDINRRHLQLVLRGMYETVNGRRGTARGARLDFRGMRMAGKTGTSQVRRITKLERLTGAYKREDRPWEERDHALFVAYAPHDRPRYAAAVIVEHGGSGAKVAAPIARDLIQKSLELDPLASGLAQAPRGESPG